MKTSLTNAKHPTRSKMYDWMAVCTLSLAIVFSPLTTNADVISIDPTLAALTTLQTSTMKDQYKKRNKMREATLTMQTTIATGLERIHDLEDKVLEYMGNASGALTNMIQIKNIADYSVKISSQLVNLAKSIPDNPKGAAITSVCNKHITTTTADVVSLTDLVRTLVSTKYSLKEAKSKDDKKHVNLLSSAERYNILMSVESKLSKISYDLTILQYFVETLSWKDLWMGLDRESYLKAISIQVNMNDIINKWNKLSK